MNKYNTADWAKPPVCLTNHWDNSCCPTSSTSCVYHLHPSTKTEQGTQLINKEAPLIYQLFPTSEPNNNGYNHVSLTSSCETFTLGIDGCFFSEGSVPADRWRSLDELARGEELRLSVEPSSSSEPTRFGLLWARSWSTSITCFT